MRALGASHALELALEATDVASMLRFKDQRASGEQLIRGLAKVRPATASAAEVAPLLAEAKAAAKRQEYGLACALFEEAYWLSGLPAHLVTAANMRLKLGEQPVAVAVYEHVLGRQDVPERLRGMTAKKLEEARIALGDISAELASPSDAPLPPLAPP